MDFTVTSKGRQFDRLAIMYFGDSEVGEHRLPSPLLMESAGSTSKICRSYVFLELPSEAGLWRPIVGIDTLDLRAYEIDITPWLPLLCNGAEHTSDIRVAGILDDG